MPDGAVPHDLGTHFLKNLEQPEHVFQLVHADLPTDFPPLSSREIDGVAPGEPAIEVFVCYASEDAERIQKIVLPLQEAGVRVWVDRQQVPGGGQYGPEAVRGIRNCKVLVLMCSDAALRSRNVKQEIQLAWKYERPILPLLLEPISFNEQVEYWLEGWQWIEVLKLPEAEWVPKVVEALRRAGALATHPPESRLTSSPALLRRVSPPELVIPAAIHSSLEDLRRMARFTDEIWPVSAVGPAVSQRQATYRGLGAPQPYVQRSHSLGSQVRLMIQTSRGGFLLLLDEGPERIVYCLCPSRFAPETRLSPGLSSFPQPGSAFESFTVTGCPGREHLLAVITDQPLDLGWMPGEAGGPARVLSDRDIRTLCSTLLALDSDSWVAMSTYFEVGP